MTHARPDPRINDVLAFWRDAGPQRWFAKSDEFDAAFRAGFEGLHWAAARRELDDWRHQGDGLLALFILLDQFPRNAFRGTAHMFATDPLARHFADGMMQAGLDQQVDAELRLFCYLPYMHSEHLQDQQRCVELCQALGVSVDYAIEHRDIIERFGRFPHRNAVLGRVTTAEEQAYLDGGGFAG